MTYAHAAHTPWAPKPKLHKPGCQKLDGAREVIVEDLTDEEAAKRSHCRWCFPDEDKKVRG